MKRSMFTLALLALLVPALAQAQTSVFSKTTKGTPDIKSIDALAFGPGALLIGDGKGTQVIAVKIESQPAKKWTMTEVADIKDKLAERIGTTGKGIDILKLAVDNQSGIAYFAIRKLEGKKDLILTLDADGKIREFALENVEFARIALPPGEKSPLTKITDVAFGAKSVLVAAQANETFAAKFIVIPTPLAHDATGSLFSTETYHVAHNNWETSAPIRTVLPYEVNGKSYLIGAFTCTPIVKYAIDDLKAGARVKGESIIELGSGNEPRDMFTYQKNGKNYILLSSYRFHHKQNPAGPSPYWAVKVDQQILAEATNINEKAARRVKGKASEDTSAIANIATDYFGVLHMDRLDADRALVIREGKDGVNLAVLQLP